MSSDAHWGSATGFDGTTERLRSFTEPLAPVVANPSESHLQEFATVIENVIVPRLLMNHMQQKASVKQTISVLRKASIADFIALTMDDNPDVAIDFVRKLLEQGATFQAILLDLLAPAARELGDRWVREELTFVEVTLGVARMHRILRVFDGLPAHLWSRAGEGLHALLLPTPGEQHTFGLRMVQEFLLRESWTVTNSTLENANQLKNLVKRAHFDVIGLSLSGETLIDSLLSSIRTVRLNSKNRHIKVIVGGQLFVERPELVDLCGADAFGADAPSSVKIVNGWASKALALM